MFASQYVILLISFPKGYPFAVIATRTCTAVRVQLYMQLFNTKVSLFTVGPAYVYTCTVRVQQQSTCFRKQGYESATVSSQLATSQLARAVLGLPISTVRVHVHVASQLALNVLPEIEYCTQLQLIDQQLATNYLRRYNVVLARQLPSTKVPSSQQLPTFEGTFVLSYFRTFVASY